MNNMKKILNLLSSLDVDPEKDKAKGVTNFFLNASVKLSDRKPLLKSALFF